MLYLRIVYKRWPYYNNSTTPSSETSGSDMLVSRNSASNISFYFASVHSLSAYWNLQARDTGWSINDKHIFKTWIMLLIMHSSTRLSQHKKHHYRGHSFTANRYCLWISIKKRCSTFTRNCEDATPVGYDMIIDYSVNQGLQSGHGVQWYENASFRSET